MNYLPEASRWRALRCLISTFGLGKATGGDQQRDIGWVSIKPEPSPVPVKGRLTVKGILDAPGFVNASVNVHLLLNDKEVLQQKVVVARANDNEIRLTTDAPALPGEVKVTLNVDPLPGEVTDSNNTISTYVTATKEGLSVLFVDRPRFPEPQLIYDALSRDPRLRVTMAWLRGAGPATPDADYFGFDKQHYDVIILGDVSAAQLQAAQVDILGVMKSQVGLRGAGLMMMGGYQSLGSGDWSGTPIDEILPVELERKGQLEERWRMQPTQAGLAHYIMRLRDDPAANASLWERLPELDGATSLGRPRPGATVLAVRRGTDEPAIISQPYGEGRSLAFAGDTTWRWLRLGQPHGTEGSDAHAHFWKQVVFWLAKRDQAEGSIWVKPDSRRLAAGARLGFSVGMRGKGGMDLSDAHFQVRVIDPHGHELPAITARDGAQERGSIENTDEPGEYKLVVTGSGKESDGKPVPTSEASARFLVYRDNAELLQRAADHEQLERIARAGGGRFYPIEDLPQYLHDLPKIPLPQGDTQAQRWPDWREGRLSGFRVALFLLFVGLLCGEWILRRWSGLV